MMLFTHKKVSELFYKYSTVLIAFSTSFPLIIRNKKKTALKTDPNNFLSQAKLFFALLLSVILLLYFTIMNVNELD